MSYRWVFLNMNFFIVCCFQIVGFHWISLRYRRGSRNFSKGGGVRRKILKEKCLLIHISTRVHMKTWQTCNSFSLLPFPEDCQTFFCFVLLLSTLFIFEIWKGGLQPPSPLPFSKSVNAIVKRTKIPCVLMMMFSKKKWNFCDLSPTGGTWHYDMEQQMLSKETHVCEIQRGLSCGQT